jgi:hypothetical protein
VGRRRASGLTARQREWLGHLRRAWAGKETVRAYARRHGLSEYALYQAAKDLRRKGVLAPSGRRAKAQRAVEAASAPARFVEVRATEAASVERLCAWRARLPNGVVIEGAGDLAGALVALGQL